MSTTSDREIVGHTNGRKRPTAKQVQRLEKKLVNQLRRKMDRTGAKFCDYLEMDEKLMKYESGVLKSKGATK